MMNYDVLYFYNFIELEGVKLKCFMGGRKFYKNDPKMVQKLQKMVILARFWVVDPYTLLNLYSLADLANWQHCLFSI